MITPERLLGEWREEESNRLLHALIVLTLVLILFAFAMRAQIFGETLYIESSVKACLGGFGPSKWLKCTAIGIWPGNKLVSIVLARFGGTQFLNLFNLILWGISAFVVFFGLRPFYSTLIVPLVAAIFWAAHSLQIAAVATVSGRGIILSVIFFFATITYLTTEEEREKRDFELAPPSKSRIMFWILVVLSVFTSPLFFASGVLLALLLRKFLNRLGSDEGDFFTSNGFVIGATITLSLLAFLFGVFISKPLPRFEGMPTSVLALLKAGFGSLGFSVFLVVYPRPVVWERYVQSFEDPLFFTIGATVFVITVIACILGSIKRKKISAVGLGLLLVGELGIIFEPVITKQPPSASSSTALLIGAAVVGAEFFAWLWQKLVYAIPARMVLIVAVLILLGIAFVRNERLSAHWADWDDLCSFFSAYYKQDPTLNLTLAEYFLSEHNAEAAESKLSAVNAERFKYALLLKARALRKLKRTQEAIDYYKKYIETTSFKKDGAVIELAEALTELGKVEDAKNLMQKYEVSGGRAEYFWGLVKEHEGEYEEAIEHFKNWLKTDPTDTSVLIALGRVLMKLKRFQQAKGYLELALNIEPTVIVVKMLSECYVKLNNCVQAENLIRRMELSPQLTKEDKQTLKELLVSITQKCYGTEPENKPTPQPPSLPEVVE